MEIAVGQTVKYLYRQAGREFPIDAKILGIDGKQITIEYIHPSSGCPCQRVLRTARSRSRLVDLPVDKPGAPIGNQNAMKGEQKRIGLSISFSGKRLALILQQLEKEGKASTKQEIRQLGYRAMDMYLSKEQKGLMYHDC